METFITKININKVRHLHDIEINLGKEARAGLVITGKNGSGKTSLLEAIRDCIEFIVQADETVDAIEEQLEGSVKLAIENAEVLRGKYLKGDFIVAYYSDARQFKTEQVKHIEKVQLKDAYEIGEKPGSKLSKYLVDLKSTQAFAETEGKKMRAKEIAEWFSKFEELLKKVFSNESLRLEFDIDTYQFHIVEPGKESFDFNTLSSGYAAILEIVSDLMMRVEKKNNYNVEGIVLIDEIETHLHLELQKDILPFLQEMFPNIQFIVTTHSPFVLSSARNMVIFDIERLVEVKDGLTDLPYEGIVEGYFGADRMSKELRAYFDEYKLLAKKEKLEDEDYARVAILEMYLDEIPDYLAVDITTEYSRLKLELKNKVK